MKAILLSRVSTHSQDLTQQTNELFNAAHKDGFSDDDIIVIEDKESAIKLSEEERNGLNELKHYINTDPLISHVYVFEVSRIARKERILFSIRDFLVEHHIQLVVLNPYMQLLDKNYEMTTASQIMFAMFGALSESEMHIKKARMLRGKQARAENGYYIGGPILFGYSVNADKKFIINEEQADVVRKMFNMYVKGNSVSAIATELCSTGEIEKLTWKQAFGHIYKLLTRHEYYGGNGDTINVKYPPIISKELFDKVQTELHKRSHPHTRIKHIYYAHKLLRCREDGHCFSPINSNCCYRYNGDIFIKDKAKNLRVVAWNINMNFVDSILWHFAKKYRTKHAVTDVFKLKSQLQNEIIKLTRKVEKGKRDIEDYKKKIAKANERIIFGKMSEKQGDEMIRTFNEEIERLEDDVMRNETKAGNLSCEYHGIDVGVYEKSVENVVDEKERYDIIHQCISVVWAEKIGRSNIKFEVVFIDNSSIIFETKPNNTNRVLLENGKWEYFKRYERFKRKWTRENRRKS